MNNEDLTKTCDQFRQHTQETAMLDEHRKRFQEEKILLNKYKELEKKSTVSVI